MRYISTRGGSLGHEGRFLDVLLSGLAPDGGLVMPVDYPRVSAEQLASWRALKYADLAFEIFSLFCDDIPAETLRRLCHQTYRPEVFGSEAITPVTRLNLAQGALHLLELSNGPTLAFKDMAMQMLGSWFEYALGQQGQTLNILGATSGDTGSAAEYAMRGRKGIQVFMLTPAGRMSPFQAAQMYSLQDPEIFNIAIDGVFDDCQDLVKEVSNDAAFKARYRIGTVNSINIGRVLAQVVYYFKAYLTVSPNQTDPVSFTVPSGNFGNVFAGHVARMMGLPIAQLLVATNENDVLHEFFATGIYRPRAASQTFATSSPSMDISKASNFERFVFDLCCYEAQIESGQPRSAVFSQAAYRVDHLWKALAQQGQFDLSASRQHFAQFGFAAGSSSHAKRIAMIQRVYSATGRVIDTHTADGVTVALEHLNPDIPMICLETALPAKFSDSIREALGREPERPARFNGLEEKIQRYRAMPNQIGLLKSYLAQRALVD